MSSEYEREKRRKRFEVKRTKRDRKKHGGSNPSKKPYVRNVKHKKYEEN